MSLIYGVIIVGMIMVFVIQFNPSAGKKTASLGEECAARVSGWCITPKDHLAAYRILIPRGQNGELQTKRAKQMGLHKVALDGLIERELLIREADRIGVAVTDDEITDSIYNGFIQVSVPNEDPALAYQLHVQDGKIYAGFRDQKTHHFEMKVYERTIKVLMGRSPTEFHEEQGRELIAEKMRDLVRSPVRVSETEALESYVGEKSTATIKYIPVKQSYVARYSFDVTNADVDAWLKEKSNETFVDTTVQNRKADLLPKAGHIRHILVKVSPTASADDKALALGKLARAVQRIKEGAAFADVARDVSDDTGSGARGGDVGDSTDSFVIPFKKAADALKPGESTNAAIETQFGYHYIERDDPAKSAEVEAAIKRDTARELYTKTRSLDATKALAAKILASIKSGSSAEDAIASSIKPLEKAQAPLPPLPVIAEAPAASTGDAGAGADAKTEHAKPAPALIPKAVTALTDSDRPQVQTSSGFNQTGEPLENVSPDLNGQVVKFAFAGKDGDVMPEPLRTMEAFVVVQLKDHKLATREDFDKERETYVQTLLAAKQAEALSLYVRRLREKAKGEIKVDEKYLAERMGTTGDGGAPMPADEDDEGM